MEIFNKSKRQFILSAGILKPEQSITVSDKEGETLLKMYAGDIIQIGNSATEKENADLKAKLAALTKTEIGDEEKAQIQEKFSAISDDLSDEEKATLIDELCTEYNLSYGNCTAYASKIKKILAQIK
jgi:hypothetical protein